MTSQPLVAAPGRAPATVASAAVGRAGHRFRRELRFAAPALLAYLGTRVVGVLILVAWGERHGVNALYRLSTLWDAGFYQRIAELGYGRVPLVPGPNGPYQSYAFFPMYPAAIRALAWATPLAYNVAALAIAWAASLVAAWGMFAVAARLYGRRMGVLTATLWGSVPVAVVESLAYSELLFTAFSVWAVHQAVARRWVSAGVLASLAGLTRPTGLAVAVAVVGAALPELVRGHRDGGPARWRPALAVLLAPVGFVGFIGWVGLVKGRWDAYFKVQEAWNSHFDFGRNTLHAIVELLSSAHPVWLTQAVVAAVLIASVVLMGVSVLQRQPAAVVLLSAATLVLALGDAAYFTSRARFLLGAFGLLLPVAAGLARTRNRATLALVLVAAALVSGLYGGFLVYVFPDAP
ncbi:hypothetical protein LN042_26300 [Kitasatospora sp. RB6PN24]|uniref:hypothetical protein n=1 Tax=Kitasatospora humi TaxID=2893891 RepID=UPI001E451FB7|nr:hypothetical protein [Kitasatospora humi]MCC9310541.1 hypothetical protein [Kitasatospora humi]